MNINTTTGSITEAELGRTLIHEHVLAAYPGWYLDTRLPAPDRADAIARVTDAFQRLHAYGIRSVVDPCPADLGRDVEFCAEVSQRSGVTLICTTGVYTEAQGIPYTFKHLPTEAIAEIYQREIEDGIGRTGIKAGLIKIATGDGVVSPYEQRMLTAAARAAKATGVPLLSHTENCSCGHDHSDGRDDHEYQASLAARGAYVGFDRFGLTVFNSDESRMKNLRQMIDAGYRDQVMVSQDSVNCWFGAVPGVGSAEDIARLLPNWTMTHLFERIFPALLAEGVSQGDLDAILLDNPRRFFSGSL
jgi:phosphotriesterase-related protein